MIIIIIKPRHCTFIFFIMSPVIWSRDSYCDGFCFSLCFSMCFLLIGCWASLAGHVWLAFLLNTTPVEGKTSCYSKTLHLRREKHYTILIIPLLNITCIITGINSLFFLVIHWSIYSFILLISLYIHVCVSRKKGSMHINYNTCLTETTHPLLTHMCMVIVFQLPRTLAQAWVRHAKVMLHW